MSSDRRPPGLFRDEALRHYQSSPSKGDVLRLPPTWSAWAYPLVLLFVAASFAWLWLGSVSRYAEGPAFVAPDASSPSSSRVRVVAFLPLTVVHELHPGQELRFAGSGSAGTLDLRVGAGPFETVSADEARSLLPPAHSGTPGIHGPVVVVRSEPESGESGHGGAGRARVRLGRQRLLFAILPGFREGRGP